MCKKCGKPQCRNRINCIYGQKCRFCHCSDNAPVSGGGAGKKTGVVHSASGGGGGPSNSDSVKEPKPKPKLKPLYQVGPDGSSCLCCYMPIFLGFRYPKCGCVIHTKPYIHHIQYHNCKDDKDVCTNKAEDKKFIPCRHCGEKIQKSNIFEHHLKCNAAIEYLRSLIPEALPLDCNLIEYTNYDGLGVYISSTYHDDNHGPGGYTYKFIDPKTMVRTILKYDELYQPRRVVVSSSGDEGSTTPATAKVGGSATTTAKVDTTKVETAKI